ncbi:MAG: hypothetical protein UY34_C0041G0002 [Parcubacteria group bacterium GW2011_GWA2_48_9]|nr:MAG: hypothetical protein UY34_C0041G0002 [Parcubacteria group bacterium GW2011_GWA2_48_9]
MPQELQKVSVHYPGRLRITTGCSKGSTVYEIGAVESDGLRSIRRADDSQFRGVLIGSGFIGENTRTFYLMNSDQVEVGLSMATGKSIKTTNIVAARAGARSFPS